MARKEFKELIVQREDNLSKDDELALGRVVQAGLAAKRELEENPDVANKKELLDLIHEGLMAHEQLVLNYVNLARKIAHTLHHRTGTKLSIEDIIQEALSGLSDAAYSYNPDKNCKLGTHAYYAISKRVSIEINKGRLVRMPENKMGELFEINKAKKKFIDEAVEGDEMDFIIETTGLALEEINLILNNMQPTVSLNAPLGDDDNGQLIDFVTDGHEMALNGSFTEDDSAFQMGSFTGKTGNSLLDDVLVQLTPYEHDLIAYDFGVFPPSMNYEDFLVSYNMTDKDVVRETRRLMQRVKRLVSE